MAKLPRKTKPAELSVQSHGDDQSQEEDSHSLWQVISMVSRRPGLALSFDDGTSPVKAEQNPNNRGYPKKKKGIETWLWLLLLTLMGVWFSSWHQKVIVVTMKQNCDYFLKTQCIAAMPPHFNEFYEEIQLYFTLEALCANYPLSLQFTTQLWSIVILMTLWMWDLFHDTFLCKYV